jgi:hypothetical protein
MPALVITRQQIINAGACDLRKLDARGGRDLIYSQGFTASELARAARENPRELAWLTSHSLLPVGATQVRAAILKEHGPDAFSKIFGTSGRLSRPRALTKGATKQSSTSTTDPNAGAGSTPDAGGSSSGGKSSTKSGTKPDK